MQRLPSWSQSKSSRDYQNNMNNVGPGQYDSDRNYKSSIGYHFGNDSKIKYDLNKGPGPGSYQNNLLKSRKSIKISEKPKDLTQ